MTRPGPLAGPALHLLRAGPAGLALCGLLGCPQPIPDPTLPAEEAWGQRDLPAASCSGDGDGIIEPGELSYAADLGLRVAFAVNEPGVPVALAPFPDGDTPWDLRAVGAQDLQFSLQARPPAATGAAELFPEADFLSPFDVSQDTDGVYLLGDGGLELVGLVLSDAEAGWLRYSAPVPLIPTPLAAGDSWQVVVEAEGTIDGQVYPADLGFDGIVTLEHDWRFEARRFTAVELPAGRLPVIELRVVLTTRALNSVAGLIGSETRRVVLLVAECHGLVARIRSTADEAFDDFDTASELLRMGLVDDGQGLP